MAERGWLWALIEAGFWAGLLLDAGIVLVVAWRIRRKRKADDGG